MRAAPLSVALLAAQSCSATFLDVVPKLTFWGPLSAESSEFSETVVTETGHSLEKRGSVTCPEQIGEAPYSCSADFCGGEDSGNAGHCKKNHCRCDKGGSTAAPPLTPITATPSNGPSVAGTFALQTISSCASLREAITTTVTATTTNTDGSTGIETAAAVVMAGGVAWFLAGFTGDVAVAEAVLEAPAEAAGHESDSRCPSPKAKCSDCTGIGGMCTIGSNPGCACEEKSCPSRQLACSDCTGKDGKCTTGDNSGCDCKESCPTGDQQPKCSDQKCKGNEQNKCTVGNKDCECKADDKCPEGEETLFCDKCGGTAGAKCIGIHDQGDKYKDCYCIDTTGFPPYKPPEDPSDQEIADAIGALPKITFMSFNLDPALKSVCQKAGWGAPQRDGDGKPSVQSVIDEWCSEMDNRKVHKQPGGVHTVFKMWKYSYFLFWLSANNWYSAPAGNKCGEEATIKKDECIRALTKAMTDCNPNSGVTHGGAFADKCVYYNIALDGNQIPDSPPWNPLPPFTISADCDKGKSSGVSYLFWNGIYPQFCSEVNKDPKAQRKMEFTQDDFKPVQTRSMSLRPRTPPASAGQYRPKYGDNCHFGFQFTGGNGNCRKSCDEAMSTLSNSCGHTGGEQNAMALSASIDAGCGKYTISVRPPDPDETVCRVSDSFFRSQEKATFTLADAEDAINKFCADDKALVSNPMQPDPFLQDKFKDTTPQPFRYYLYGDTIIEILRRVR